MSDSEYDDHNRRMRNRNEREEHLKTNHYKGPKTVLDHLPFFHRSPAETPPAVTAVWISVTFWILTTSWFAISLVGYCLIWKFTTPLPPGETMNIERIFDTIPLNRWAVNVVVSLFASTALFLQTLLLVGYKMDRRVKRDFAREMKKGMLSQHAVGDQDAWDALEFNKIKQSSDARPDQMVQPSGSHYQGAGLMGRAQNKSLGPLPDMNDYAAMDKKSRRPRTSATG